MSFARLVESVGWMLLFNLAFVSHCKFHCVVCLSHAFAAFSQVLVTKMSGSLAQGYQLRVTREHPTVSVGE